MFQQNLFCQKQYARSSTENAFGLFLYQYTFCRPSVGRYSWSACRPSAISYTFDSTIVRPFHLILKGNWSVFSLPGLVRQVAKICYCLRDTIFWKLIVFLVLLDLILDIMLLKIGQDRLWYCGEFRMRSLCCVMCWGVHLTRLISTVKDSLLEGFLRDKPAMLHNVLAQNRKRMWLADLPSSSRSGYCFKCAEERVRENKGHNQFHWNIFLLFISSELQKSIDNFIILHQNSTMKL